MPKITTILLFGILLGWAWVLGRPLLATILDRSKRDPVGHFNRQISTLSQKPPGGIATGYGYVGTSRSTYRKRRRTALAFVIAALVSLVLALVFRGVFIAQHLVIDAAFVGFGFLAARAGAAEAERNTKVSYLGPQVATSRPTYLRAVGDR